MPTNTCLACSKQLEKLVVDFRGMPLNQIEYQKYLKAMDLLDECHNCRVCDDEWNVCSEKMRCHGCGISRQEFAKALKLTNGKNKIWCCRNHGYWTPPTTEENGKNPVELEQQGREKGIETGDQACKTQV